MRFSCPARRDSSAPKIRAKPFTLTRFPWQKRLGGEAVVLSSGGSPCEKMVWLFISRLGVSLCQPDRVGRPVQTCRLLPCWRETTAGCRGEFYQQRQPRLGSSELP